MGLVYVIGAVAACAGLLFGFDTGAISGALLFIRPEFHLTPLLVGVITSAALAGAAGGSVVGGALADRIGRRTVILITAGLFCVGSLLSAVSASPAGLIFSRLIIGVAIGVASFVAPMYLSEISPPRTRGFIVALNQLAITLGILASYVVDYAFEPGGRWRWMLGVGVVPAVVLLMGMLVMPESPRWLALAGQREKALGVLRRVRPPAQAAAELADIQNTAQAHRARLNRLLAPDLRMPLVIGVGLAILQQVTGINTVIYYAPMIFESAGMPGAAASILATMGVGLGNVLMTIIALMLLDRVGRRPLLLVGEVGMVASLAILAVGFALGPRGGTAALTTVSLVAYVGFFAIGLGPVFWLMISEIYPLAVRGAAMSVATFANWFSNLLVTLVFPSLIAGVGPAGAFAGFAMVGVLGFVFSLRLVPETKGRTLEEIERQWSRPRKSALTP
jgi:sugar porter (SP) family MFS transporter